MSKIKQRGAEGGEQRQLRDELARLNHLIADSLARREAIFRELTPTRVAYLGPEFTFSHLASLQYFGDSVMLLPNTTIRNVFDAIEKDQSDYGVVPIDNSTDGRVTDTLDCFSRFPTRICGEIPLQIRHCLFAAGEQQALKTVVSKPQALSQCRNWVADHLPGVEVRPVGSTAEAVTLAANDSTVGAIASEAAGRHYGLPTVAREIQDQADNVTRFVVIGRESVAATGHDKMSLMFEVPHRPGALADAMAVFKELGLNMTWIESFPIPGSRGSYLFFVECQGHETDEANRQAVEQLSKQAVRLSVLGSYPQADPIG